MKNENKISAMYMYMFKFAYTFFKDLKILIDINYAKVRHYMAERLQIRRNTPIIQSINQSINQFSKVKRCSYSMWPFSLPVSF